MQLKLVPVHMCWQWTLCPSCLLANFAHSSKEAAVSGVKSDDICVNDVLSVMRNVIRIVYIKYSFLIVWTNRIRYLLFIYFNNKPLHVSSRLATHQEDRLCTNSSWYRHALCWLAAASQHKAWLYKLLFIQSRSFSWWTTRLLETCRGLLMK